VNFYNTFVLSVGSDRTPASALTKVHTVSITFVRLLSWWNNFAASTTLEYRCLLVHSYSSLCHLFT
ncbi:hypothetical protein, partial [Aerosakkonema funiforme]|uniref:hypothetical protein n=1 Tax=Aerosakkonema funiforme TaxID=1246630 RepID=UPI001A7F0A00